MPCDDRPVQAPCCGEGCDAVPRSQEGGGPEAVQGGAGTIVWAAFSSTSPDMKDTKAFLSKKKDPEENEEEEGNLEGH